MDLPITTTLREAKNANPKLFAFEERRYKSGEKKLCYFGVWFKEDTTFFDAELILFRDGLTNESDGYGRFFHFKRIVDQLWAHADMDQKYVWHDWNTIFFKEACKDHRVMVTAGPSSSGKTDCMAIWAIVNYICAPQKTMVLCLSKTLGGASKTIWGRILQRWNEAPSLPGKVIDSKYQIRCIPPFHNEKAMGIYCVATESSSDPTKLKHIGYKQKRIFVFIDELPEVHQNIVNACFANTDVNRGFRFIGGGNPSSHFDPHGMLCTPKGGWQNFDASKMVYETADGICIRYNGEETPNKYNGNKFGWLIDTDYISRMSVKFTVKSREYYRFVMGLWYDGSQGNGIFNSALLTSHKAMERVQWANNNLIKLAGFDPAFTTGGDSAMLQFATIGDVFINPESQDQKTMRLLQFDDTIMINPEAGSDRNHRMAEMVMNECKDRGVNINRLGVDSTAGGGILVCEVLEKMWGGNVYRVNFGGRASDHKVSDSDSREGHEAYVNRVTELWFNGVEYVRAGQIRGVSSDMAKEFLAREYDVRKDGQSRSVIESKGDYKRRMQASPDTADAGMVALCLAKESIRFMPGQDAGKVGGMMGWERDWRGTVRRFGGQRRLSGYRN